MKRRKIFSKNLILMLFLFITLSFGLSGRVWGIELITNGGFETDADEDGVPDDWIISASTVDFQAVTDQVHGGTYAASVTKIEDKTSYAYAYQVVNVVAEGNYTLDGWVYLPSSAIMSYVQLRIKWLPSGDTDDYIRLDKGDHDDVWWELGPTVFPAPTDQTSAEIQCYVMILTDGSTDHPAYFDDVSFTSTWTGPKMTQALANNTGGGAGVDSGDTVVLTFDSLTNGYDVTEGAITDEARGDNLDTNLDLSSDHTWGDVTSASWDSYQKVLTITLAGTGSPSIAVDDSITIKAVTIMDPADANNAIGSPPNISGTFDPSPDEGKVVINEIMWDEGDSFDEYIELRNTTASETIDIGDWEIHIGGKKEADITSGETIVAEARYLIGGVDCTDDPVVPDEVDVLTINQSSQLIVLYDENGLEVDSAGSSTGSWFAGSSTDPEGISMERKESAPGDGTVYSNWYTYDTSLGTVGGRNGTPGDQNSPEPTGGSKGDILINEVAPDVSSSKDWIEFQVKETVNIHNWSLYQQTTQIKLFPEVTVSAGDYIILWLNRTDADDTVISDNNTDYWDFYATKAGITGHLSDNVIILKDVYGKIIDAVSFADNDGDWTTAQQDAFVEIVNANEWDATAYDSSDPDYKSKNESQSADWSGCTSTKSMGRDNATGVTDDDDKDDWYLIASPTKGEKNPSSLEPGVHIKINEVSFKADNSRDWVELYCKNDGTIDGSGVDIGGCYFEDDGTIKTIAKGTTIKRGEYLVLQPASGCMTVTFIDVGAGDSILVQTPGGERMLIDGGQDWAGEDKVLPYLDQQGVTTIDLMVATHAHDDHYEGLEEVLDNKAVNKVWLCGSSESASGYADFITKVDAESDCTKTTPTVGTTYTLDEDYNITATVLNNYASRPIGGGDNASSIVIHLKYGNVSFMLTGDAESSVLSGDAEDGVEEALVSAHGIGLTSDVLKVGHHGSADATSNDFLTYVYPDIGIISTGSSTYEHPRGVTLQRLIDHGVTYYCTGVDPDYAPPPTKPTSYGNIEVFTNGMSYWMDELTASDGIINIFAHSTSTSPMNITSTDEQVIFKDGLGSIEDAVCWANQSGTWSSGEEEDVQALVDANQWSIAGAALAESDCFDSTTVDENDSIARDADSSDNNTKDNWSICSSPTRGKNNGADMPSGVGISGLGVSEDPFLSDGSDLNRRHTKISFTLNMAAEVTAQVLDGRGRPVRTLGEDKYYIADSFSTKWDGKNGSGDSVPIGYYTIYIKAIAEDGNSSTEATITVTVAKSLSGGGSGGCFIATAAYTPQSGVNPKHETQHQSRARCWTSPAPKRSFWCGVRNPKQILNPNYQMFPIPSPMASYGAGKTNQLTNSSYCPPEVMILRQFRDQHLLTNPLGRAFVSTYNRISPPIAEFISDKEPLKAVVRTYLRPIVWLTRKAR